MDTGLQNPGKHEVPWYFKTAAENVGNVTC
jgi:hypothetical protein